MEGFGEKFFATFEKKFSLLVKTKLRLELKKKKKKKTIYEDEKSAGTWGGTTGKYIFTRM